MRGLEVQVVFVSLIPVLFVLVVLISMVISIFCKAKMLVW